MPYKYLSFYLDDWLSLLLYLCTPKDIKEIKERKATSVIVGIELIVGTSGAFPNQSVYYLVPAIAQISPKEPFFSPMHLMAFYAFLPVIC